MTATAETTVVFLGTSLPQSEARQILPGVTYRPPIARGELAPLVEGGVQLVAIIDGVFHQAYPVSPFEIRDALRAGVQVVGAASMGALRAAELYTLGMIGVGTIFEWYKTGRVMRDDEVALSFDPETFRCLTVPLVNVRHALDSAVREGVLEPGAAAAILAAGEAMHFRELTYRHLLAQVPDELLPAGRDRAWLGEYLAGFDLKRDDAIACLHEVRRLLGSG